MSTSALPDLLPFLGFAALGSFTPGPNTTLALAVGTRFGWRCVRTHAVGVALGLGFMIALAAFGALALLLALPGAERVLRWGGVGWMLWLAWQVSRGGTARSGSGLDHPPRAWQSALLQWVNPKAWMLAIAVAATWSSAVAEQTARILIPVAIFGLTTAAANYAWAALGSSMQDWLSQGRRQRGFDLAMGALLAVNALALLA